MSQSIHADTVLGEVKLKVSNLERSIKFYREVVGFQLLSQDSNNAQLTADGINPLLILEEIPNAAAVARRSATGLYHFAILVPTREQLGLSLRSLIKSGIHIGQGDHLVSEALYIADPDQNGIEIYCDRPRSTWRRDADNNYVMASDPVDIEGLLNLAGDQAWAGLVPGTIIGHIHLHVRDLAESRAFYCDVMGFDMAADAAKTMGAYFISAGGYHHHIGMNIWAGIGAPQPPANGTGLAYYRIVLPSAAELDRTLGRITDAGNSLIEKAGTWIVKDPSGIEIRLSAAKV